MAEPENHPCEECGRTDLPLHIDYRCPDHSRYGHGDTDEERQDALLGLFDALIRNEYT